MPGYTHLQVAQPLRFSHHLLAYYEMFGRDRERLADSLKRLDVSPLGAGALAGTGFPIDRDHTARALGFSAPARTSAMSPHRSEEHTSELQSRGHLVCRLLLEKKK